MFLAEWPLGGDGIGRGVAANHCGTELREFFSHFGCARVVWKDPAVLGREAESNSHVKIRERLHLPVEPGERIRTETVGPGQAGAQMLYAEPF